ncbi:MAG: hypothetical protein BWX99_01678 [Deltaproteobacteria bacterium ADurb.Bin151]|nr:MAG: hypothetical protein BWX99_01678 [Deltaproteobacteria bacterium ADurb.Bin151]
MKTNRILKQIGVFFVTSILIIISSQITMAATYYVRSGATGNGSGLDWTNAYTTLPSKLDRGVDGSTYYIADGNYEGYLFNSTSAPVDGTKVIAIKKATSVDHGTNTGWISSYGDGQAIFKWSDNGGASFGYKLSTFRILTSYITIDGATGSGSNPTAYGFRLVMADGFGGPAEGFSKLDQWNAVTIGAVGQSSLVLSDIKLQHLAAVGPAATKYYSCFDDKTCSNTGFDVYLLNTGSLTNLTVKNVLSTHWNNNISIRLATNATVDGCYVSDNWSSAIGDHGQNINIDGVTNGTIKNNHLVNSDSFAIALHQNSGNSVRTNGLKIYNNLFYGTNPSMSGFIATMTSDVDTISSGMQVHHNTIVGQHCGGKGFVRVGTITNLTAVSYVYNNLFYNTTSCSTSNIEGTSGVIVHDYNAYISSTGYTAEANGIISAQDPFVDSANGKYQLKAGALPINKGKALIATYSTDYNGITRPQGGAWDIGAYEYLPAQSTLFVTSVNGRVTSNPSGINCGSTCYANFDADAGVTLTASSNSGYTFAGWSGGGCSGTGTCMVSMASAQTVTANFAAVVADPVSTATYYLSVSKTIVGAGIITASDNTINCGSTCTSYYNSGKKVTLTVSTNSGYKFSRWTGACKGQGATCTVSMTASQNTKAYFAENK